MGGGSGAAAEVWRISVSARVTMVEPAQQYSRARGLVSAIETQLQRLEDGPPRGGASTGVDDPRQALAESMNRLLGEIGVLERVVHERGGGESRGDATGASTGLWQRCASDLALHEPQPTNFPAGGSGPGVRAHARMAPTPATPAQTPRPAARGCSGVAHQRRALLASHVCAIAGCAGARAPAGRRGAYVLAPPPPALHRPQVNDGSAYTRARACRMPGCQRPTQSRPNLPLPSAALRRGRLPSPSTPSSPRARRSCTPI